jgi:hypothetical protein
MGNLQKLSAAQEKLHLDFKYCGGKHLEFRQKCIGMLPQIHKEKIYKILGFDSISEYAAKLAGLSQEQVKRVLSLDEKFSDLPVLKNLLETGEVSINKLARVASIATIENQQILADKVKLLPNRALETLIRDEKMAEKHDGALSGLYLEFENPNGSPKPENEPKFVHVHKSSDGRSNPQSILPYVKILEKLSPQNKEKLLELINKEIDINEIISRMLQSREEKITEDKEEIAKEVLQKAEQRKKEGKKPSRYIPAKVQKILKEEHGTKCSIPGCNKPAKEKHHTQRFALAGTNDPRYMAPLCEEHHIIAQTIDIKYIQVRMRAVSELASEHRFR